MAAAFFFIMTYEGLNIHSAWTGSPVYSEDPYFLRNIQLFSFVLLNISVVMLYRKIKTMHYWLPSLSIALLMLPLLITSFLPYTLNPV